MIDGGGILRDMSINLIAINMGNSRCQIGQFIDGELKDQDQVATSDLTAVVEATSRLFGQIKEREEPSVYVGAVVPETADRFAMDLASATGVEPVRLERDVAVPISRQLDPEAIVGVDRLLNAVAAFDVMKEACVVVDAGTAMTVDFVDGDGTFHGGAILPGASMMLQALADGADQLPLIELSEPAEAIGHSTVEAIRSGVVHGLRGAVRELTERYAEFYQAYPRVIATGGDASLLFQSYDLVERVVPELTLQGMAVTYRRSAEETE
jgi:type III pantothenate kinase